MHERTRPVGAIDLGHLCREFIDEDLHVAGEVFDAKDEPVVAKQRRDGERRDPA